MKLLLIEDNTLLVKTLKSFLSKNYTVQTALTGEEGIYQDENETYDLIILDLKLPDMDGEDVCQKIREQGIGTPVLILTVKNSVSTKVQMLQIGADDYLTKPFHAV